MKAVLFGCRHSSLHTFQLAVVMACFFQGISLIILITGPTCGPMSQGSFLFSRIYLKFSLELPAPPPSP